jgi:hypothetical protein
MTKKRKLAKRVVNGSAKYVKTVLIDEVDKAIRAVRAKRAVGLVAPFTSEELKVLFDAAHRTWEYIGYDCLMAVDEAEENPKKKGDPKIDRAGVIELVIDANRLEDTLDKGRIGSATHPELAKKMRAVLDRKGGYDLMTKLLEQTFTFERYGL